MTSVFKSAAGKAAVLARYREILAHWPVEGRQLTLPTRQGETFVIDCGPRDGPALCCCTAPAAIRRSGWATSRSGRDGSGSAPSTSSATPA